MALTYGVSSPGASFGSVSADGQPVLPCGHTVASQAGFPWPRSVDVLLLTAQLTEHRRAGAGLASGQPSTRRPQMEWGGVKELTSSEPRSRPSWQRAR